MSDKEKEIATRLVEAFEALPNEKKERWLGYAEGVMDATARCRPPQAGQESA